MDSISRLVTTLKNAAHAKCASVTLPYSAFTEAVLNGLKRAGFVGAVSVRGEKHRRTIEVELIRKKDAPSFTEVRRISKPSRRLYRKADEIRSVRNGYGRLFLTTSKGIMTDTEARKAKVGGEPLFQIW